MVAVSFFEQLRRLGQLIISSPIYIGLSIIFILLFIFQFLNVKRNSLIVRIGITVLFLSLFLFVVLGYHKSIFLGIDYLLEKIILNLYFPSIAIYIIVIVFSYILFIITTFRQKFSNIVKKINIGFFTALQFLFSIFLITVITKEIDISSRVNIYQSNDLLVVLQVSMILFVIWLLVLMITYYIKIVKNYLLKGK